MKRLFHCTPLVCCFALLACEESVLEPADVAHAQPHPDASLESLVCTGEFFVAHLEHGASCPPVMGWTASRLFPDGIFFDPSSPPEIFAGYCRYRFGGGVPGPKAIARLTDHDAFDRVGRDCMAVTPEGDAISVETDPWLRNAFHWLSGRLSSVDLDSGQSEVDRSPVMVSVVDTLPGHLPDDPVSDHGPIVRRVVEELACPGTSCAVQIPAVLGLPRTDEGYNLTQGGVIGLQKRFGPCDRSGGGKLLGGA